jgi:hypothetical protein
MTSPNFDHPTTQSRCLLPMYRHEKSQDCDVIYGRVMLLPEGAARRGGGAGS